MIYENIYKKREDPSDLYLLYNVRLHLKRQPGAGLSSTGDMEIKWPASQPRRPVAASATPSRLLKGDTIPINVFLSTLLRCLFNTAPGGFRARTAWVKLHFSGLKERCDKSLRSGTVRDCLAASNHGGRIKAVRGLFVFCFFQTWMSKPQPAWTQLSCTFQAQTPSVITAWLLQRKNKLGQWFSGTGQHKCRKNNLGCSHTSSTVGLL